MLFDQCERTLLGPRPEATSNFTWMNLCAEPYANTARVFLEGLMNDYPDNDRSQLVRRFRSENNSIHRSAFFELITQGWLKAIGHEVLEIEPSLEHTSKRPDFLVRAPSGQTYYLEATARSEPSDHLAEVKDAINALQSPLYLDLKVRGEPDQNMSARQIARIIADYIESLDPDALPHNWRPLRFVQSGVTFHVTPFQKKSERNMGARTIGCFHGNTQFISSSGDLKSVLKRKASRYGQLDRPYIIALACPEFHLGLEELTNALFGSVAYRFNRAEPERPGRMVRNRDGLWNRPIPGPSNTGVSGVLFVPGMDMTAFASRSFLFILHPEPRHPASQDWFPADTHIIQGEQLHQVETGQRLGLAFDLEEVWPN